MSLKEKTETALLAFNPNIPAPVAAMKAASIPRAIVFFLLGLLCILAPFALIAWLTITTKAAPPWPLLIFAALPLIAGIYFLFAGGNLLSGEAMDAAERTGGVVARTAARALKVARVKA
jgi:hypothetical protein